MVIKYIPVMISGILYAVIFSGLLAMNSETLKIFYHRFRVRNRLKARRKEHMGPSRGHAWLSRSLLVATGRSLPPSAFIAAVVSLFIAVLSASIRSFTIFNAVLTALAASAIPFLLLYTRVNNVRRKGSEEGETLVSAFLNQYRINDYNIFVAIENVLLSNPELKISRRLLFHLLLELRDTGDSKKIKEATEDFSLALKTKWGRLLAHNIRLAADRGDNVSIALEDILIQLREARSAKEELKRLNSEAVRMACFMVPFAYLATSFLSVIYLDLSPVQYLINQFTTPQGLCLFMYILLFFTGNLALLSFVSGRRFDF